MTSVIEVELELTEKPADYNSGILVASDTDRKFAGIPRGDRVMEYLMHSMDNDAVVPVRVSKDDDHYRLDKVGRFGSARYSEDSMKFYGTVTSVRKVHVEDITRICE